MRFFRTSSQPAADVTWWRDADAAAGAPSAEAIARLQQGLTAGSADEVERRDEFLEGLRHVLALSQNGGLPRIVTQHRVIGDDICHFVAPVSLAGQADTPGKLFVTAERLVFAGSGVLAWPWHRMRSVARIGRDLVITVAGAADALHVQCNSYGDALTAEYMARQLVVRGS